jgi:hypothetical protein
MTHDEARRLLEATSDFDIRDGRVLVRDVRWLRAIDALRDGDAAPPPPRRPAPSVSVLAERAR